MTAATFRRQTFVYTLGVLAFAGPACRHGGRAAGEARAVDSSEVVAKVDDAVITVSDVQARINKQAPFARARYADPARKRQLVEELVQNEALAAEAARRGFDKDPDVQRAVKQQMVAKLVQRDFDFKLKAEDVPEADVEKYYNEHPAEFHQKDAVGVRALIVKSKGKADRAYAQAEALPKGPANLEEREERFSGLVTKYSDFPASKSLAAELLFFYEDSTVVPKAIVEAAFRLKAVGDLTPPLEIDQGWAVVLLTQKRPGINRSLTAAKRQIQKRLFRDLRPKALAAFVEDLQKKSRVTINDANLSKVVVEAESGQPQGLNFPGGLEPPLNAPPSAAPGAQPVGTQPGVPTSGPSQAPVHP
jgi:peptidyl-prolyl cis-trans isomerase C